MSEYFGSPFSNVLNTNYAASSAETDAIYSLLESPRQELSQLADEIARVQRTLDRLGSRRNALQKHVDAHLALVSPFRRLPSEIISAIFLHCLPTDRNPTRSMMEAPLSLTVISKGLREIALSTPCLWNALHVFLPNSSFNGTAVSLEELQPIIQRRTVGVEAWFNRSRSLPLSISIYLAGYGRLGGSVAQSYIAFLQTIVSFSQRWKHIELHLSPFYVDAMNTLVDDLRSKDVPLLESVEVFYDAGDESGRTAPDVYPYDGTRRPLLPLRELITRAPSLQSFAIHHHSQSLHQLQLPWSNLTDLTMKSRRNSSRLTVEQTLHILANSPNLSTCTLGVSLTPNDTTLELPGVVLHSLHSLSLYFLLDSDDTSSSDAESLFHNFFSHLLTPNLVKFAFIAKGFEFRRGMNCIPFRSLLERSDCKLEELYLSFPLKTQSVLVDCLQSLPTLTYICLEPCMSFVGHFELGRDEHNVPIVDDVLISHLTPIESKPDTPPVCPRLERLVLPECKHVSERALMNFLRSRTSASKILTSRIAPLKLLDVRFAREMPSFDRSLGDGPGSACGFRDGTFKIQGTAVVWKYLVRQRPVELPDSPWGGQPRASYSGWNPEVLSQYIKDG